MTNPQKRKGDRWERAVVRYFNDMLGTLSFGRIRAGASADEGDLWGDPLVAYECRDRKQFDFSGALKSVAEHAKAANKPYGIVVWKRTRRPVEEAYVVMTLETYTHLRGFLQERWLEGDYMRDKLEVLSRDLLKGRMGLPR